MTAASPPPPPPPHNHQDLLHESSQNNSTIEGSPPARNTSPLLPLYHLLILFHKNLKLKFQHPINTLMELSFPLQIVLFVFVLKEVLSGTPGAQPEDANNVSTHTTPTPGGILLGIDTANMPQTAPYYPIHTIFRPYQMNHSKLALLTSHSDLEAHAHIANFSRHFCPCRTQYIDDLLDSFQEFSPLQTVLLHPSSLDSSSHIYTSDTASYDDEADNYYLNHHRDYALGALDIKPIQYRRNAKQKHLNRDVQHDSEAIRFLLINRTNIMDMNQTRRYAEPALLELQYRISQYWYKLNYPNSKPLNLRITTQEIPENTPMEFFNMAAQYMYPFYFAVSALNVFHPHLVNLVTEKKQKLKSMLEMVGCSMLAYNLSWYLISALQVVIIMMSTTLLVYVLKIFRYTNALLFMIAYMLYLVSFLPVAHIFSVFFSEPKSSSFVSQIFFMVALLSWAGARFILSFIHPWWLVVCVNFISPIAFMEFMYYLVISENDETGLTFSNLSTQDVGKDYDLRFTLAGLVLDNILYFAISHYIDQVVSEDSGRSKPLYYFLLPGHWKRNLMEMARFIRGCISWCTQLRLRSSSRGGSPLSPGSAGSISEWRGMFGWRNRNRRSASPQLLIQEDDTEQLDRHGRFEDDASGDIMEENFPFMGHTQQSGSESDPADEHLSVSDLVEEEAELVPRIQIRNLTKTFTKNKFLFFPKSVVNAVDDLNLDLYNGINAITGHNSAGKTTICRLLTSQLAPTSGKIYIHGLDIDEHWSQIREHMCVCPQDNVLWDKLSCFDHLKIIGEIKGIPRRVLTKRIDQQLKRLDLFSKKFERVEKLSGGQKRRLCFLMTMIGSKPGDILLLDEVSCGVDAVNRRRMWNMLQEAKKDRTIVLVSHSMEEADYLADHIAIMKRGRLEVCGNSLFLKKHYSIGYTLKCMLEPDFLVSNSTSEDSAERLRQLSSSLEKLIQEHIPDATSAESTQKNILCFTLPYEKTNLFSSLFKALESSAGQRLHIKSFSLSVNTLEEIFMKVTDEIENQEAGDGEADEEAEEVLEENEMTRVPRRSVHQRTLSELNEAVLADFEV